MARNIQKESEVMGCLRVRCTVSERCQKVRINAGQWRWGRWWEVKQGRREDE